MNSKVNKVFEVLQIFLFPLPDVMGLIIPKPCSAPCHLLDALVFYPISD